MTNPTPGVPVSAAPDQTASPDTVKVKSRQRDAWGSGDYSVVGTTLQIVGEELCEAIDLRAGERVLDVAAGNGNASLAAARRHCEVVSTDYVAALLERGSERAAAERLPIEFRVADAEALPFGNASFDAVVSTFGVMFVADHDRAAAEMLRVVRPGGKIGLANWTPEGFIGQMFKVVGKHVPPPAGVKSPLLWGSTARLGELFASAKASVSSSKRDFNFRYKSPAHFVDVFRTWYGPVHKAFGALDKAGQAGLENDLIALIGRFNVSKDATMIVPSEYLEVIVTRG